MQENRHRSWIGQGVVVVDRVRTKLGDAAARLDETCGGVVLTSELGSRGGLIDRHLLLLLRSSAGNQRERGSASEDVAEHIVSCSPGNLGIEGYRTELSG